MKDNILIDSDLLRTLSIINDVDMLDNYDFVVRILDSKTLRPLTRIDLKDYEISYYVYNSSADFYYKRTPIEYVTSLFISYNGKLIPLWIDWEFFTLNGKVRKQNKQD